MMSDVFPVPIQSRAGVKQDGTRFEGGYYVAAKWCRFQRGRPRKMGGYNSVRLDLSGIPVALDMFNRAGLAYIHSGHKNGLESFTLNAAHVGGVINNRTPGGFVNDANNAWQFAQLFDATSASMRIIAHAAPNRAMIDNDVTRVYYFGDVTAATALTAVASTENSGGIVALHPYLVRYSSDGFVGWSVPNKPDDIIGAGSGSARVTASKIVRGLPLRSNSGNSPAGLLWSLTDIIRMYFVGGAPIFSFDVITSHSSILSANAIVEYDGIYYWPGIDRFLMFNGVLQPLPNDLNLNFFYDKLTPGMGNKVFGYKIPRFGEIVWCAPLFGSTEPNWAIIYNVFESQRLGYPVWYDTPLPEGGRGAALYPRVHDHPFMAGIEERSGKYTLWHHENGVDKIDGTTPLAVESYFETADTSFAMMEGAQVSGDKSIRCEFIEPDFVQTGPMTVAIIGRQNARSVDVSADPLTFPAASTGAEDEIVRDRQTRRQMRFRFTSNVLGGDYQMGQPLAHIAPSDGRITS